LVNRARALGWQEVDVIDDDLGVSGSGTRRAGFERLLRALCDGQVGAVFSIEASRLARNGRDWHTLLEFCSVVGALLIDAEAVYDPRVTNDRLLLGMKGTISEMEVASFRERAHSALLQKAQRGALVVCWACSAAWGCKSPAQPDGGEGLVKTQGLSPRGGV
jgi:DNA invertase Pin-like site-specific DNA recombinase